MYWTKLKKKKKMEPSKILRNVMGFNPKDISQDNNRNHLHVSLVKSVNNKHFPRHLC